MGGGDSFARHSGRGFSAAAEEEPQGGAQAETDTVKVFVRARPVSQQELELGKYDLRIRELVS